MARLAISDRRDIATARDVSAILCLEKKKFDAEQPEKLLLSQGPQGHVFLALEASIAGKGKVDPVQEGIHRPDNVIRKDVFSTPLAVESFAWKEKEI